MNRQTIITLYASFMKRAFLIFSSVVLIGMICTFMFMVYQHSNSRETRKISFRQDIENAFQGLQDKIEHKTLFMAKGLEGFARDEEIELLDRLSDPLPSQLSYRYALMSDPTQRRTTTMAIKDEKLILVCHVPETLSTSLVFSTPLVSVEKILGITLKAVPYGDGQDEVLRLKNGQKLYFHNPMGDFFYSFSKRYHYESMLLVYVSLFLMTFFALGTGIAFFFGHKKTVGSFLSLIQEVRQLRDTTVQMEKEVLLLKEQLLYQKNRDTFRKRMRAFLEKYYNQRLKKLKDLSILLSNGLENGSLEHDESCLITHEIKDLTGLLYDRIFETRLQDQINMADLWEKVKGHLMPTLLRANVSLFFEKTERSVLLENDEKFLELFLYAQLKALLTRCYQDSIIEVRTHALKGTLEISIQVKGVLLSAPTLSAEESIDLGFMKMTIKQIEKLGKSLEIKINTLEDGHFILTLPVKPYNLPKREIKGGNVVKLHA